MEWKDGVVVEREHEYKLILGDHQMLIAKDDEYIIDAVEDGITDDMDLLQLIMDKEETNDIISSFRLAQVIVDYGEYLAELKGHMIIEP